MFCSPSGKSLEYALLQNLENETLLPVEISDCIRRALAEDIGTGDVTTDSIVPAQATLRGRIIVKQYGVVAGLKVAEAVWHELVPRISFSQKQRDGSVVGDRTVVAEVVGPARALLTGER